jgi:hypothetical protein
VSNLIASQGIASPSEDPETAYRDADARLLYFDRQYNDTLSLLIMKTRTTIPYRCGLKGSTRESWT